MENRELKKLYKILKKKNKVIFLEEEERILEYRGQRYTSYYQLEKVMGINRKTIQYRHEVKGLPLEEVPDFSAGNAIDRFGDKRIIHVSCKKKTLANWNEVIEYPENPQLHFSGSDPEKTAISIEKYQKWLEDAPEVLILRERYIQQIRFQELQESEKSKYFYASTYHEEAKTTAEKAIEIVNEILNERGND
ncbi:hypothetical protein [Listeria booriae]|uniref:Uncharacterized protein n=1 Tax=Listeria booriae TaxID=1552123 RepID=A0A842F493_9LIST|nr:hypothetical protein [Listeria booriae]MBC2242223.1 hypothetical protein [Listeria booriae]